jgi:hypothetical protein
MREIAALAALSSVDGRFAPSPPSLVRLAITTI